MAKYDRFHPETAIPQMEKDIEGKADKTELNIISDKVLSLPKITFGTADPSGGENGDIYIKIV